MERDDTVIKYPMYDTMYYFKNEPNTAFISNAVLMLLLSTLFDHMYQYVPYILGTAFLK